MSDIIGKYLVNLGYILLRETLTNPSNLQSGVYDGVRT